LRYPGGKAKALKMLLPLIPRDFSEYREPFVGGGSVFIAVKQLYPSMFCRINDLNYDVYCLWSVLKRNADELICEITRLQKGCCDGRALYSRLACSNPSDVFHRALRFYILNRITYSGTGDCGGYSSQAFQRRFTLSSIEKLKPLSKMLQNVEITNDGYERLLFEKGKKVFIYLDPPYWRSRKSHLYGKDGDLHRFFDHERLAENVRKCEHNWLVTCDDSKLIRKLFSFANIIPWQMQYGMNNVKKKNASKGKELFITNYNPAKYSMLPEILLG
jgi:DNA adenine methylase